jgi:hypothetical protein
MADADVLGHGSGGSGVRGGEGRTAPADRRQRSSSGVHRGPRPVRYQAADLYITRLAENLPLAIIEAMACGHRLYEQRGRHPRARH